MDLQATTHFLMVSSVRVVTFLPKKRSVSAMRAGALSSGIFAFIGLTPRRKAT